MTRAEANCNERMFEFAERVGWELQKRDEMLIRDFCSRIGVKKRVLKVWLRNNKKNSSLVKKDQPTADILPEFVIHKILSYLNYREASWMTFLSKTWLQAWLTHPNLLFRVHSGLEKGARTRGLTNFDIVNKIMKRYRDGKIPIDKFEFHIDIGERIGYHFFLIDKWIDIALQNGVKYIIYRNLAYNSSFPIYKMLNAKYLRELVLTSCNLVYYLLPTSRVGNCHSLRKLSLDGVTLDDNMLQTLLASYSLIVDLIIRHCRGWKKFEVRNLQKIRSLTITIERGQLVEIQAPTLEHLCYTSYSLDELDITQYQNLKSLELSGKFDTITLDICISESLRVLKFDDLRMNYLQNIGVIDAPNLVSFEYKGDRFPQLKFAKESSKLKNLIFDSYCYHMDLDDVWFCQLREFLSNSTSWSQVSLVFSECKEIDMEDLQLHHTVAYPQVDVLDVYVKSWRDSQTFADALLWSCHPRRLNISSTVKVIIYFIDRLLYIKNLSHSTSHGRKPQLGQLKKVKAYKFDGKNESWHPVELRSRELKTSDLDKMEKFYFLSSW